MHSLYGADTRGSEDVSLVHICIKVRENAGYILAHWNMVLLPIDMDVSLEHASPFRFEKNGSYLSVNLVIISPLPCAGFFNFEHGGSKFIHGIQNVQ